MHDLLLEIRLWQTGLPKLFYKATHTDPIPVCGIIMGKMFHRNGFSANWHLLSWF